MNNTRTSVRILAILVLFSWLVGAVEPAQTVRAAAPRQESTESWGTFSMPAPQPGRPPSDARNLRTQDQQSADGPVPVPETPIDPASTYREAQPEVPQTGNDAQTAAPGTLTIFNNASLGGQPFINSNGTTVEPSAANNGKSIFASYNWDAALSVNDGANWYEADPYTIASTFCCDQDVLYDPSRDAMFWTMIDTPFYDADHVPFDPALDNNDGNTLYLAVFNSKNSLDGLSSDYYTLVPDAFCSGGADEDYFDFPHLVRTDNYLYLIANVFRKPTDAYICTTAIRISLDELDAAGAISLGTFYSSTLINFTAAHGGTDTLYFALHVDNDTLRIFKWPESVGGGGVTTTDVNHGSYLVAAYNCDAKAPFSTGVNPCGLRDDRLTTGWLRRDLHRLGFMWDAPQGTDSQGTFAFPRIRYLVLDVSSGTPSTTPMEDSYIWNSNFAWILASAGVNARGHVGGTATYAGGTASKIYPGGVVWAYDDYTGTSFALNYVDACVGSGDPASNRFGDYMRTRVSGANPFQWIATCYAKESGSWVPRVVRFGRQRDTWNSNYASFDGNPRSEIAVVRGGAWLWYDLRTAAYTGGTWTGAPGGSCIPASLDYDGDGDKNFSMLCGSAWHFYDDNGSYLKGIWLGATGTGAVPVPADYDGDGKDDPVVFNAGAWHAYNFSTGAYDAAHSVWTGFPGGGGKPAPIDIDGDHVMERSFLSSAGGYYFYSNTGVFLKSIWAGAVAGQLPVPGDYNGDGVDDVVVWRAGAWMFYNYATGAYDASRTRWTGAPPPVASGGVTVPAPLDYDGDGSMDFTVYSAGPWHFYKDDGSYEKGVWVGAVPGDQPISRRPLP